MTRGRRAQPSGERTEEERERDRVERERRRAERAAGQDAAAAGEAGFAEPPPSEEPAQIEAAPAEVPTAHAPAGEQLQPAPAQPAAPDPPPPEPTAEHASSAEPRLPPAPPVPPASRGARAVSATPARARRSGGRSPLTRALALLALAAVVIAAIVLLVKSLAGSGKAKPAATATAVRVVIPEGSNRLQIASIAAHEGLSGSYRTAARRSSLLDPRHYGARSGTPDLEGFLFPATYDMFPGAPASRLVEEQLIAFHENFGAHDIARAHALHVTPYQLLTVASMIEREAKVPGDRPKIAAVIYNRLSKGMPLGVDATIYYALEMQKGIPTYTKELTEAQLQLNSAYNTRTRTGLPPTPISNPGLASIEAAANPAHVDDLYYVLAPDGCGEHVFSSTLAKFEVAAAAYQAAVRSNGGAPPTCKK